MSAKNIKQARRNLSKIVGRDVQNLNPDEILRATAETASENSVDGTWGSYTIQEGENDLFLLNNRNGKKYKFNLTEVN